MRRNAFDHLFGFYPRINLPDDVPWIVASTHGFTAFMVTFLLMLAGVSVLLQAEPSWSILGLLSIPALVVGIAGARGAWLRATEGDRVDTGKCARCGYDLRGSPDRCPECGTEAKAITR